MLLCGWLCHSALSAEADLHWTSSGQQSIPHVALASSGRGAPACTSTECGCKAYQCCRHRWAAPSDRAQSWLRHMVHSPAAEICTARGLWSLMNHRCWQYTTVWVTSVSQNHPRTRSHLPETVKSPGGFGTIWKCGQNCRNTIRPPRNAPARASCRLAGACASLLDHVRQAVPHFRRMRDRGSRERPACPKSRSSAY